MPNRPNILFILGESHAADLIAATGHPLISTPNLDRLVARGTVFDAAYCASPLCVPARAALATGRYPHETGYWDSSLAWDGRVRGWMHGLRDAGYHTRGMGKMHFRRDGDDYGFCQVEETMHIADGLGDLVSALRHEGREPAYPGLWDVWTRTGGVDAANPYRLYDARIAAAAERALGEVSGQDDPWAMSVHFIAAHAPFVTPPEFAEMYRAEDMSPPRRFAQEERPDHPSATHLRRIVPHDPDIPVGAVQAMRAANYATVSYLDHLVGRVLDALEASGQAEETLVIYTSDHGFGLGDHYLFGLFHLYEEALRVPLIIAGPGVPEGRRVRVPVSHVDLCPTILRAAGAEDAGGLGRDLWPILTGEASDRGPVFAEYHGTGTTDGGFVLRDGAMKLIHFENQPPQMFDLAADPEEGCNLATDRAYAGALLALQARLSRIVDTGAVDTAAKADQAALIARHGGRERVLRDMAGFAYSPPPGLSWREV